MLKDLPEGWTTPHDPFIFTLRQAMNVGTDGPLRVHRGVYLAHINFDKEIEDLIVDDIDARWPRFDDMSTPYDGDQWFSCYGVVDHWTQLPLQLLDADERNLLIFLGRHAKADQSSSGGWRWHKWGPYLGVFQEQAANHEYLYDTPDVVEVWSYQIVVIK